MARHELTGPGSDGLYRYRGATIELSSVGTRHWWATVRFRHQEIDFEARSSDEALEKAMGWIDAAPEMQFGNTPDDYGRPSGPVPREARGGEGTAFKHLLFGTRFRFADPEFERALGLGREGWTYVKTGHNTYRNPLSPPGKRYEHRIKDGNVLVVPEHAVRENGDDDNGDERDHREVTLYDDEALELMQGWWGSSGDPLYAIYSMGGRHEAWVFEHAISNLDSDIARVQKLGRNKYQLGRGTFTKKEIDELHIIRDALAAALEGGD